MILQTGADSRLSNLGPLLEICFSHPPTPGGTLHHYTARPGPARPGSHQARPGRTPHNGSARLGPRKPVLTHTQWKPGCLSVTRTVPAPHPKDSQDQYGFTSGWPQPAQATGLAASTRPGPARALCVDSDNARTSWVTPIRYAPIDLVSGARGIPTNGWPI